MKLTLDDVHYRYSRGSRPILNKVSFELESGSYWCVAGPNGAGKSTLLKLICGLLPTHPDIFSGKIDWDGVSVRDFRRVDFAKRIAFVPGILRANFPATVEDFILQGRYPHSNLWAKPSSADREIAENAMVRVGLEDLRDAMITEISGGETQLALIARAFAQQPEVLILDEATSNLDLAYQIRIYNLLNEFNLAGTTVLVVSHDLNFAAEYCPNAIWMLNGEVFKMGSIQETFNTAIIEALYEVGPSVEVGRNPVTRRPKIFLR